MQIFGFFAIFVYLLRIALSLFCRVLYFWVLLGQFSFCPTLPTVSFIISMYSMSSIAFSVYFSFGIEFWCFLVNLPGPDVARALLARGGEMSPPSLVFHLVCKSTVYFCNGYLYLRNHADGKGRKSRMIILCDFWWSINVLCLSYRLDFWHIPQWVGFLCGFLYPSVVGSLFACLPPPPPSLRSLPGYPGPSLWTCMVV